MIQNSNGNGSGSDWRKIGSYTNPRNQREYPIVVNTRNCCVQQPVGSKNNIFAMIGEMKTRNIPHEVDKQVLQKLQTLEDLRIDRTVAALKSAIPK